MKKTKRLFFVFLCVCCHTLWAQKHTISGYVKDGKNGEVLIGVNVYEKGTTNGVSTNAYGFYSLTLSADTHLIVASYLGYATQEKKISLSEKNVVQNFELSDASNALNEVVVSSEREDQNVKSTEMSVAKLDMKQISRIPALLGEIDIIRAVQLLPGVTTMGEGASGINVRGGNIDQNLILLDEAPVYNASHLFGFFSIFNPDAVKDVKIIKGGIPAQYGGRLSSILDIRMKEGNSKKLQINGGIGTIFSRLSIEAPLIKDKMSFIVAVRRSYIDILAGPVIKKRNPALGNLQFYFYDLTTKLNYHINEKNNLFLSGYFGQDVFGAGFSFKYGNSTASMRWNHLFNDKLFLNTTAFYSNYHYGIGFTNQGTGTAFDWTSNIINYSVKPDFTYYINNKNTMHAGGQSIFIQFNPGQSSVTSNGSSNTVILPNKFSFENALYIDDELKINSRFVVQAGLRYSLFNYMGKGERYNYYDTIPNNSRRLKDSSYYGTLKTIAQYGNFEPRFSAKFDLNDASSIKASYNRTAQYLQLVSNTAASTPLDIWTPSTNNILPQLSDQVALGYFRNFKENMFESSVEVYYKVMQNQLDYIDNANLLLNKFYEGDLLQGKGRAYGAEFYFKKTKGKFTGWVSYTYSRTLRQVNGLSNDKWFPSKYDRPNNLAVVLNYDFNKYWNVSCNFIYISGTPNTFPDSRFEIQGYVQGYNTSNMRNNFRNPAYHRLDFSATYNFKKNDKRRWKSSLVFSIYNAYAHRNTFALYFQANPSMPTQTQALQYSVISTVIPAITYNFKF
ncbi:MAG: TonB-dependent receptor [Bacteroidetes bacterium]|nr:TonB-dependent receptor [Bacteroidota bacterium]